jgi:hypothetical protein
MTEALIVIGLASLTIAGFTVAIGFGFGMFGLACLGVGGVRMRRGVK